MFSIARRYRSGVCKREAGKQVKKELAPGSGTADRYGTELGFPLWNCLVREGRNQVEQLLAVFSVWLLLHKKLYYVMPTPLLHMAARYHFDWSFPPLFVHRFVSFLFSICGPAQKFRHNSACNSTPTETRQPNEVVKLQPVATFGCQQIIGCRNCPESQQQIAT